MTHDATRTAPHTWRGRFDALVSARMHTPFAWGEHDCCLWAADCVRTITGTDPAADVRGTYQTALEAARVLQATGGLAACGQRAGAPIAPLCARVGDVGIVNDGQRDALAVCSGDVWLVVTATGLGALPISAAWAAWRVAHG